MKRLLVSLLITVLLSAGCGVLLPTQQAPPVIDSFEASPAEIGQGESSILSWSVSGASTVTIDQGVGEVALTGTWTVSPSATTTYTLSADDGGTSVTARTQVVVRVEPDTDTGAPTIESFEASPLRIASGESSSLSWSVSGAHTVTIDNGIGEVALTGTKQVSPSTSTTYRLTAAGETRSVTAVARIEVAPQVRHTETLYSISSEDGHVSKGGTVAHNDLFVGDGPGNRARQCFLSFDISEIPIGATIKAASLDIGNCQLVGRPFAHLGWLRVYNDQYATLGPSDFTSGFPAGAMYTYDAKPTAPLSSQELIDRIQTQLRAGNSRFQVRLQFQKQTDFDGARDGLEIVRPTLVITWER